MSRIIDFVAPLEQKAGQGGWNDMDMLEVSLSPDRFVNVVTHYDQVGNGGMNFDEYGTDSSGASLFTY